MKWETKNTRGLRTGLGALCMVLLATPVGAVAQTGSGRVSVGQTVSCPSGITEGSLGITGLDCVGGRCGITIREGGRSRSWSFSTEPRVVGVTRGGPTDGVLESGDFLVAIDGILITTQEGGRRYAMLQPGERVRLRYRRDGRTREALVGVEAGCRELPHPVGVAAPAAPVPDLPDEPRSVGIAVAPKVRVISAVPDVAEPAGVAVSEAARAVAASPAPPAARGPGLDIRPMGRLGVGFSCSHCGTRTDDETGESIWFFSGPLEVTAVRENGPADRAGVQMGDLITAIDGAALDSEAGGRAFTNLTPGENTRLTVLKRNGSEVQLRVVPEEARSLPAPAVPEEPVAGVTSVSPAAPRLPGVQPDRAPAPTGGTQVARSRGFSGALEPPAGLPHRFSGTMDGVDVEVRGRPVTVSEVRGARTFIVNADGLWIRITVPARRIPEGQGAGESAPEAGR